MIIEQTIKDYLEGAIPFPVYVQKGKDNPGEQYVIIEKTGSQKSNKLITSTLAVQSYATRLFDAATLNETVKEAMEDAIGLTEITSVKLQTDYNFTSTTAKQYRYQAVFVITHY